MQDCIVQGFQLLHCVVVVVHLGEWEEVGGGGGGGEERDVGEEWRGRRGKGRGEGEGVSG